MSLKIRRREAAERAIEAAGGCAPVARRFKITYQSVQGWLITGAIPTERIRGLCRMTKLEAWQIDPAIPKPSKRYREDVAHHFWEGSHESRVAG